MRDNIAEWIEAFGRESIVAKLLGSTTGALECVLYSALGSILRPIIGSFRKQIEEEKGVLLKREKTAAQDSGSDILSPGSTATNPLHSQFVAKDQSDYTLNIPTDNIDEFVTIDRIADSRVAQVAAAVTDLGCWDDESLDNEAVTAGVLEFIHHPFNMSESSEIQTAMFNAADRWWAFKQPNHCIKLLKLLQKDTICGWRKRVCH